MKPSSLYSHHQSSQKPEASYTQQDNIVRRPKTHNPLYWSQRTCSPSQPFFYPAGLVPRFGRNPCNQFDSSYLGGASCLEKSRTQLGAYNMVQQPPPLGRLLPFCDGALPLAPSSSSIMSAGRTDMCTMLWLSALNWYSVTSRLAKASQLPWHRGTYSSIAPYRPAASQKR